MATRSVDEVGHEEQFRRRFQHKLAEKLKEDLTPSQEDDNTDDKSRNEKKSPLCVQNLIWLGLAVSVFYFSDFLSVVLYDGRIKRTWFWIGVSAISVHVGIASFLVLWVNTWKKVESEEWDKMYPKAVPIATASFILGSLCLSVSLWPVWGFLTPLILGSLFMGAIVLVAMFG